MQTPDKADDPLALILTKILSMALSCPPRSEQQVQLVKAYGYAIGSGHHHEENFVSAEEIMAVAKEARALLANADSEEFRAVSGVVNYLHKAARQAQIRVEIAEMRQAITPSPIDADGVPV